jgi:hypothetical protein
MFVRQLRWKIFPSVFESLTSQLAFGVQEELCDLMSIEGMQRSDARGMLHDCSLLKKKVNRLSQTTTKCWQGIV